MKTITSIEIAKMLNREHRNVLRNIRAAIKSAPDLFKFTETEYENHIGRKYIAISFDRENAMMLVGEFRLDFKERAEFVDRLKKHFDEISEEKFQYMLAKHRESVALAQRAAQQ